MTNPLVIVSAVNGDQVLAQNLLRSRDELSVTAHVIEERGHLSAGAAYNAGLDRAGDAAIVAFIHQDVYLPAGWCKRVHAAICEAEDRGRPWGVLGVFGACANGRHVGRVWSSGLGRAIGERLVNPVEVVSLDEVALILRRSSGLRFDAGLPGFHLYGTDIVQQAIQQGLGAYVIDAPLIHNSRPVRRLGDDYWRAYAYMRSKWRDVLPIATCVLPIQRSPWVRWRRKLRELRVAFQRGRWNERLPDPAGKALELGYEQFECHSGS
jgi:hypothetical protein